MQLSNWFMQSAILANTGCILTDHVSEMWGLVFSSLPYSAWCGLSHEIGAWSGSAVARPAACFALCSSAGCKAVVTGQSRVGAGSWLLLRQHALLLPAPAATVPDITSISFCSSLDNTDVTDHFLLQRQDLTALWSWYSSHPPAGSRASLLAVLPELLLEVR